MSSHALVTGGSRGIGFRIAERLSSRGCRVTLMARSRERLEERVSYLNSKYPLTEGVHNYMTADLTDPLQMSEQVSAALSDTLKSVNVLVNCAGQTQTRLLLTTSDASIASIYNTNLVSPTILCHLFSRSMVRQRFPNASILNVSSALSLHYLPGTTVYSASKAALNTLTTNLSAELSRRGSQLVRVNAILPGLVEETEMGGTANQETIHRLGLDYMRTTLADVSAEAERLVLDSQDTGRLVELRQP